MPELMPCPTCPVTLRVPDGAAGKAVRCPKCQAVIPVPPPPPPADPVLMTAELLPLPPAPPRVRAEVADATVEAPALSDEPLPPRPMVKPEPGRKRTKRPKRSRWFAWVPSIEGDARLVLVLFLLAIAAVSGLAAVGYYAVRAFDPPTIAASEWETVEVPGRFRAKLPGWATRVPPKIGRFICEPNETSLYMVWHADRLPLGAGARPIDEVVDQVAGGMAVNGLDVEWKEVDRKPVTCGKHEGRQLVYAIRQPRFRPPKEKERVLGGYLTDPLDKRGVTQMAWAAGGSGRGILRIYFAHDGAVIAFAGGRNFAAHQENVKRLFDSLEILDPDGP